MECFEVKSGEGPCAVQALVALCGSDINITLCGGTHPHVGGSALALPRPSLKDPAKRSASESVLCVPGHKDEAVAKEAAHRLAAAFGCVVCASAGLHLDGATPAEIAALVENARHALDLAEEELRRRLK